ncbi:MAG: RAMP superfamily CRISPR-associated protein [Thermodesulfovibrionales bacterium]
MEYKAERIIIAGKLGFETSLHIGSGEEGDWIDSTIIKTKKGKPFVPATTIAGVFRELAERNFSQGDVEKLFGYVKKTGNNYTKSCASRLIFCDAFLSNESKSGYRNGVGIRRDSLTSREGALFSLETVEKPTFDFNLIIDNPCDGDMRILEPILAEFQSGRVAIGADKSRGLGWVKLSDLKYADIKPDNLDSFVDYLVDGKENLQTLTTNKARTEGKGNYTVIEYILTLEEMDASLIVSSGVPGFSEDADQTLVIDETTGKFFIPGSSIKGPLRSQAERIIRFLGNKESACDPTDSNGNCSAKVKEIKKQNKEIDLSTIKSCSCLICMTFGNGYLASKVFFTDAYDNAEQNTQFIDNVAIDRFTGGALEGAKFNTEVATKVNLKGKIILKDIEEWQAGLIAFLVRDWMMGDIRIGFGKMKGYGRCKVDLEKITLCWQDDNWLKDKIKENNIDKNGFYNRVVLEGNPENLTKYKSDLDKLTNQLKEKVKK